MKCLGGYQNEQIRCSLIFGLHLFAAIWNIAERGDKMSNHFIFLWKNSKGWLLIKVHTFNRTCIMSFKCIMS